jgi:hypothetical protein
MKLTSAEIEFLAAWAREEWQPKCYQLPAHRLQLTHGVSGALLIDFIKTWTRTERKKDQDIQYAATNPEPIWPWSRPDEFKTRHGAIRQSGQASAAAV